MSRVESIPSPLTCIPATLINIEKNNQARHWRPLRFRDISLFQSIPCLLASSLSFFFPLKNLYLNDYFHPTQRIKEEQFNTKIILLRAYTQLVTKFCFYCVMFQSSSINIFISRFFSNFKLKCLRHFTSSGWNRDKLQNSLKFFEIGRIPLYKYVLNPITTGLFGR